MNHVCLIFESVHLHLFQFSWMSIPSLAGLNGEVHGSTTKRLQRGCTPVTCQGVSSATLSPSIYTPRNQIHGRWPEACVPSTLQEIYSPDHQRAMSILNPSNTASLKCTWSVLLSPDAEKQLLLSIVEHNDKVMVGYFQKPPV